MNIFFIEQLRTTASALCTNLIIEVLTTGQEGLKYEPRLYDAVT